MHCERCTEDLTAYLDGELSDDEAEQVRIHLETCKSCAQELRSLMEAALLVESHLPQLEPCSKTWNLVQAQIPTHTKPYFFRLCVPSGWRAVTATSIVILALVFGLWGYIQHEKTQRDLEEYMSQYIRAREAQEQMQYLDQTDYEYNPYAENPFAEVRSVSFSNPFRSED